MRFRFASLTSLTFLAVFACSAPDGASSSASPDGDTVTDPVIPRTSEDTVPSTDAGKAPRDAGVDAPPASAPPRVRQVALGLGHTCVLLEDGHVKCWGLNHSGQLGLGDEENRGDQPGELGAALPAVDLGPGRTAKEIALLSDSTCAVLDDGTVKCWGEMRWITGADVEIGASPGQMGAALAPLPLPGKVKHLAGGYHHLCARLEDDTTRCFGGPNGSGQLGVGDETSRMASTTLPAVALGAGRTAKQLRPGTTHTCALLDDGSVTCWGDGFDGELGSESKIERHAPEGPVNLGAGKKAVALATSAQPILATLPSGYNCALLEGGSVKCWGYDSVGLGLGHAPNAYQDRGDEPGEMGDALPAVSLGTGKKATAIAVGMSLVPYVTMSCVVLEGGSVKCWGFNEWGTLGVGDQENRGDTLAQMGDALPAIDLGPGFVAAQVAVGSGMGQQLSACAVSVDGRLKCWGGNKNGQLGLGDTTVRGASPAEMGAGLPYVDLGP